MTYYRLPPLRDEYLFEDFCCAVWSKILDDPHVQRLGRRGQKQWGIDILGTNIHHGGTVVIQCRSRESAYIPSYTEIEDAIQKIDAWGHPLRSFILAHSGAKCSKIDKYVAGITAQRQAAGKCTVHVFAWEDLAGIAESHPDVLHAFFPELLVPVPAPPTVIERIVTIDPPHTLRVWRNLVTPLTINGKPITTRKAAAAAFVICMSGFGFATWGPGNIGLLGFIVTIMVGAAGFAGSIFCMCLEAESRQPLMLTANRFLEADAQRKLHLTTLLATCWCGSTADVRRAQTGQRTEEIICCRRNPRHPLHRALHDHTVLGLLENDL